MAAFAGYQGKYLLTGYRGGSFGCKKKGKNDASSKEPPSVPEGKSKMAPPPAAASEAKKEAPKEEAPKREAKKYEKKKEQCSRILIKLKPCLFPCSVPLVSILDHYLDIGLGIRTTLLVP